MKIGSPEWIRESAAQIGQQAHDELMRITTDAATRHGLYDVELGKTDMARVGMVIAEISDQSFILGVQMGLKVHLDSLMENQ